MVFEIAGRLRYHALWAYTALTGVFVGFDKIPIDDFQAAVALLAPIAFVITADIVKNRNKVAS
jgi:hypothetical protein